MKESFERRKRFYAIFLTISLAARSTATGMAKLPWTKHSSPCKVWRRRNKRRGTMIFGTNLLRQEKRAKAFSFSLRRNKSCAPPTTAGKQELFCGGKRNEMLYTVRRRRWQAHRVFRHAQMGQTDIGCAGKGRSAPHLPYEQRRRKHTLAFCHG